MTRILLLFVTISIFSCKNSEVISLEFGTPLTGYNPCEPSIAINPTNTDNIVAGAILNRYYYTKNGGKKWVKGKLKSEWGVHGDPMIIADQKGNFYYMHLSNPTGKGRTHEDWIDRIICEKSVDGGKTFDIDTYMGHNPPKDQDKHWAIADPNNGNIYVTWTQFDKYNSADPKDRSNIMFSVSKDGGLSWSDAKIISEKSGDCLDGDQTTEGAVPAVGPNGEIYVAWSYNDTIWFDVSLDEGETWLEEDIVVCEHPGGWEMDIPDIMRSNGMPVTLCDLSEGPNKGTIYINFADQKNGPTDTEIRLVKSKDGGKTWTDAIRVNQDQSESHQFFTWMAIDQSDGSLYCVYYDRRRYIDTRTDVVMAWSRDGGESFKEMYINDAPFIPDPKIFFGDYNNIDAVKGIITPIWTEADGIGTGVYTRIIKSEDLD